MKNIIGTAALVIAMAAGSAGFAAAQNYGYDYGYDRDDRRYHDADDYRYSSQYHNRDGYSFGYSYGYGYGDSHRGYHAATEFGFRDGAQVAREDMWRGKPFNPMPRGRYDDADHGYSRAFGNRHEYREHYADAYRRGYESAFRGYRNGYDR